MSEAEFAALANKTPVAAAKQTVKEVFQAKGRLKDREMNKLEERYALHLDQLKLAGAIKWWAFELIKIKLAKNTHITIDFFLMTDLDELQAHDTKPNRAVVEDDALAKTKVAAELCPWKFFFAYPNGDGWTTEQIGR